jgi:predicted Zn-ribbon and HTH transcriptional regulator
MAVEQMNVYRCEHVFKSGAQEGQTCGHIWTPRKKKVPTICPLCRSPRWNNGAQAVADKEGSTDAQQS